MSAMLSQLDTDLSPCPTLLLIGAPAPDVLADLLTQPRARVVLAEPDPDLAAKIEADYDGHPSLKVIAAAVCARSGRGELVSYNQPGLRSLHPATAHLKRLFPGLKPRARSDVRTITIKQFLQQAGKLEGTVELRLETGGEEADILRGLIQAGGLENVAQIVLHCGVEPLFEGAEPLAVSAGVLRAEGFALEAQEGDDPDWPELRFGRDPLVAELRRELETLGNAHRSAKTAHAAKTKALEKAHKEAQTKAAADIASLKEELEALAAQHKQREAERDKAQGALATRTARVTELEGQLAQARETAANR
ncbi:MAG: FkbM family methyltransferase, partial [Pelagimonas sp.]|uniref:FkbM family methyltransferase n=1 Tax=Pelagimonas sp. TaxID=2073170 RepID=UPI003D6BA835